MGGLMISKKRILTNTPHLETASGSIASFGTDRVGKLAQCKVEFLPVQSGYGNPSPSNIRPISGWAGVDVYSAQEAYKLIPTSGTKWTDNGITVEHLGNGKYHVYGTASGTAVGAFIAVGEFVIPSSDGRLFQIKNSVSLSSASIRLMYNQTIVETWDLSPANRNTSTYSGMQGKTVNGFVIRRTATEDFDFTIEPTFTKNLGTTIPVSWTSQGAVYRGYVDAISGTLTATHKLSVYDGSSDEAWNREGISIGYNFYTKISDAATNQYSPDILSNIAKSRLSGEAYEKGMCFISASGNLNIAFASQYNIETVYALQTFLRTTNLQVIYKLKTSESYQLSTTQIKTLLATNNIWSNANGNTTVKYWTH